MWRLGWREAAWDLLDQPCDVLVIGGGITGAGILREAARAGLRALLVEQRDFAYGTSSRSSKLVHGGLRYLKNLQVKLTAESVRERERLLREARGLVVPLGFILANYQGDRPPAWVYGAGLVLYDMLALRWGHRQYGPRELLSLCPPLSPIGLEGGYRFLDAQVDDARLVLRVLSEALLAGGNALNYTPVLELLRGPRGEVRGAVVADRSGAGERTAEVQARVVINATGVWADDLRRQALAQRRGPFARLPARAPRRLRRLRGSHLVFPAERLPLVRAVSCMHPADRRPAFFVPWDGVTLLGTTDVDHGHSLDEEPAIEPAEVEYLLEVAAYAFPCQNLTATDVQATFSGVRPVVNTGKTNPSAESREHVLWDENGLLTVAGGKLTTFRLMARAALAAVRERLPTPHVKPAAPPPLLHAPPKLPVGECDLGAPEAWRLAGRYGLGAPEVVATANRGELARIRPGQPALWAELRWAARAEGVVHLDDLLLRRVRLGLTCPHGALGLLGDIRPIVQPELGWTDARWQQEASTYAGQVTQHYMLPGET